MKELVVISGKGGTGKTSIVASFATLAEKKVHPRIPGWKSVAPSRPDGHVEAAISGLLRNLSGTANARFDRGNSRTRYQRRGRSRQR